MLTPKKSLFFSLLLAIGFFSASAQTDNLLAELESDAPKKKDYAITTFKSTRLIDGSTIESLGKGVLDFRISHRFGRTSDGIENFYGIDNAVTQISLDYGITDRIMVGIGHSVMNKENNGFVKIKLLKQASGGSPVTLSYFAGTSIQTTPAPTLPRTTDVWNFTNRLYYAHQILIARKFSSRVSLQLMPTVVHYNIVDSTNFSNNTYAIGFGGRIKMTKRAAITAEYYLRVNNQDFLVNGNKTYNSFSIGYELETGGHVFQLMVTNSQGMTERTFIGQTTDNWAKNQLHIGFNISREFTIIKPEGFKEPEKKW